MKVDDVSGNSAGAPRHPSEPLQSHTQKCTSTEKLQSTASHFTQDSHTTSTFRYENKETQIAYINPSDGLDYKWIKTISLSKAIAMFFCVVPREILVQRSRCTPVTANAHPLTLCAKLVITMLTDSSSSVCAVAPCGQYIQTLRKTCPEKCKKRTGVSIVPVFVEWILVVPIDVGRRQGKVILLEAKGCLGDQPRARDIDALCDCHRGINPAEPVECAGIDTDLRVRVAHGRVRTVVLEPVEILVPLVARLAPVWLFLLHPSRAGIRD